MPDVLDSFVIELGLDPKKLDQGQRQALASMSTFREEALRNAKGIEDSSRRSSEAISTFRTAALETFAVLAGGKGILEFATHLTTADAAVGRLSRSTGIAPSAISRWQGAARLLGGDAQTMAASFTTMSDALQGWKVGAGNPQLIADFAAISKAGGHVIDINKGVAESYLELADNLKAINDDPARGGPAMAGFLGRRIGLDPAFIDMLIRGRDVTKQILDQVNALGPATKNSADAAGDLVAQWNKMVLATEGLARHLGLTGFVANFFGSLSEIEEAWTHGYASVKGSAVSKVFGGGYTPPTDPNLFGIRRGGGAFSSQAEKEAFIRSEAERRGIDPDQAMRVARSEGFSQFIGDQGTSFGAFQLHYKSNIPGLSNSGLGDSFTRETGLQAGDPANERATIQYALDKARSEGWGAWHGWHGAPWAGINRGGGASGGSTTTTTVQMNGPITIQAGPNASASDIAQKLRELGMRRAAEANQSSVGSQ